MNGVVFTAGEAEQPREHARAKRDVEQSCRQPMSAPRQSHDGFSRAKAHAGKALGGTNRDGAPAVPFDARDKRERGANAELPPREIAQGRAAGWHALMRDRSRSRVDDAASAECPDEKVLVLAARTVEPPVEAQVQAAQ